MRVESSAKEALGDEHRWGKKGEENGKEMVNEYPRGHAVIIRKLSARNLHRLILLNGGSEDRIIPR